MKRNLRIDRKTHCNAERNHREADDCRLLGARQT